MCLVLVTKISVLLIVLCYCFIINIILTINYSQYWMGLEASFCMNIYCQIKQYFLQLTNVLLYASKQWKFASVQ